MKKRWCVSVAILGIIFIFILVVFGLPILKRPTPGVSLTKINEGGIPTGTIIHLSDKDFDEFPTLATVIRDNAQRGETWADGIHFGIKLSYDERTKFMSKYPSPSINRTTGKSEAFFEYKGQYYSYLPPWIP